MFSHLVLAKEGFGIKFKLLFFVLLNLTSRRVFSSHQSGSIRLLLFKATIKCRLDYEQGINKTHQCLQQVQPGPDSSFFCTFSTPAKLCCSHANYSVFFFEGKNCLLLLNVMKVAIVVSNCRFVVPVWV